TPPAISLAGKRAGYLTDELSGVQPPSAGVEVVVPVSCLVDRAILLSYGCEIDKDKQHRLIALIRPMSSLQPAVRAHTRAGRRSGPHSGRSGSTLASTCPPLIRMSRKVTSISAGSLPCPRTGWRKASGSRPCQSQPGDSYCFG